MLYEVITVSEYSDGIFIRQSPDILKRIYIEVTNSCNLDCSTCVRNVWSEDTGMMEYSLFGKIITDTEQQLEKYSPDNRTKFTVFFGGWGEPLLHPEIIRMIKEVKVRGWRAELITNGVMLDNRTANDLIGAGLDFIWVSLDGATPESYSDVLV